MTNRIAKYLDQPEPEAPAEQVYTLATIRDDQDGGTTFTVLARFRSEVAAELSAATLANRLARSECNRVRVVEVLGQNGEVVWWKGLPRTRKPEQVRLATDMVAVVAWSLVLATAVAIGFLAAR